MASENEAPLLSCFGTCSLEGSVTTILFWMPKSAYNVQRITRLPMHTRRVIADILPEWGIVMNR